jgi:hypothetical protein
MFTNTMRERTLAYSANQIVSGELARGGLIRELYLRLTQAPTVTGAANTAAAVRKGGPWGVIQRLEVILNGSDVILSLPGYALPVLAGLWMRRFPRLTATLGDSTTANPSLDDTLVIPFLQPYAAKPMDTVLDVRRARQIEVRVTWGSHLNVSSGASGYTANPSLEISSLRSIPSPSEISDDQVFTEWRRITQEISYSTASSSMRVDLSTGYVYRGCVINLDNAGDDEPALLTSLKVKSGATVFQDLRASTMRELARTRYGVVDYGIDAVYGRGQNDLNAWLVWDQVTDGRLAEAIDTLPFSEFYLECETTVVGTPKLILFPWLLIPPRV